MRITRVLNDDITAEIELRGVASHVYAIQILEQMFKDSINEGLSKITIDNFDEDVQHD